MVLSLIAGSCMFPELTQAAVKKGSKLLSAGADIPSTKSMVELYLSPKASSSRKKRFDGL